MAYTLYNTSINRAIITVDDKISNISKDISNDPNIVIIEIPSTTPFDTIPDLDDYAYWDNKAQEVINNNNTIEHHIYQKKQEVAYSRMQAEALGITINGIRINTDRDSQAKITGAVIQAIDDPTYVCQWKTDNGTFVTIDANTIKVIGRAVREYIQSCFDKEATIFKYLSTLTTIEAIDAISWDTFGIEQQN